jgi:release factor glutamine methyltransferase
LLTVREALQQGTQLLVDAAVAVPRLTAEVLLSHAIGCRKAWLYAHSTDELREVWWIHYGRYLHERINGKPTQYITGKQEFYGRDFRVTPAVLIPRPETEFLVEAVVQRYSSGQGLIADIGTGSGAIAVSVSLELKGQPVIAVDLSADALEVARGNAAALQAAAVEFVQGDLLSCFAESSLAVIASNPPYIPEVEKDGLQKEVREFEPHLALFGGPDGMQNYRSLVSEARRVLRPGGWLAMELAYNAFDRVRELMSDFQDVELIPDLAGYPRVIAGRLAS